MVAFVIPIDVMKKMANIMMQHVPFHTLNFKKVYLGVSISTFEFAEILFQPTIEILP